MACSGCDDSIWKQKLGRCRRCMWLNFMLLVVSGVFVFFMQQTDPKSVQTIAMLFAFLGSAILMLLHVIAFLYYHFFKADKRSPK